MEPDAKSALANFLGFAMSKSKELDSAIVPGSAVSRSNIDNLIAKAANEVESKFGSNQSIPSAHQSTPLNVEATIASPDIRDILIPFDDPVPAISHAPPETTPYVAEQLEFNFTDPNPQTKLILSEIDAINKKLNKVLALLESKGNKKR